MDYSTTGTTERLRSQKRTSERVVTVSVHSHDRSVHISYRATLSSYHVPRTALGFFLGVVLALAAFGAATITPTLGFCVLLALVALGSLLAQGEDG